MLQEREAVVHFIINPLRIIFTIKSFPSVTHALISIVDAGSGELEVLFADLFHGAYSSKLSHKTESFAFQLGHP